MDSDRLAKGPPSASAGDTKDQSSVGPNHLGSEVSLRGCQVEGSSETLGPFGARGVRGFLSLNRGQVWSKGLIDDRDDEYRSVI